MVSNNSYKNSHSIDSKVTKGKNGETHTIVLGEVVSFFSKASILRTLKDIPGNSNIVIDYSRVKTIDYDVQEILEDQANSSKDKKITLNKSGFKPETV